MLQGFAALTTFTTWHRWFKWDSLALQSNVLYDSDDEAADDDEAEVARLQWAKQRTVDADGRLADELNANVHCGDPEGTGVIWPHLAEVSLVGGLGCGGTIVRTILADLEQSPNNYTHVVLQVAATQVAMLMCSCIKS